MPIASLIVLVALVRRSWRLRLRARPVLVIVLVMLLLSHWRFASSCSCARHLHHRVQRVCCSSLVCYRRRHLESLDMRARASRAMAACGRPRAVAAAASPRPSRVRDRARACGSPPRRTRSCSR
mmetsp:Transcript_67532/g.191701  ORF Transcript_67532/g.191701 Transcript_67532/m.191701 type:complete len:124 (+) Transcript_67532:193-564(+)